MQRIIDLSQEVFSCRLYPGDPAPVKTELLRTDRGDAYNLTAFSMCAHNGTHVDAPFHFLPEGETVDRVGLVPFVGRCMVVRHAGDISAADAEAFLRQAREAGAESRLLIAGPGIVTAGAARVFAARRLRLCGVESQTVGPQEAPEEVHRILLGAGTCLLEGIVLDGVEEGAWFLCAAPLNLGGCDGAPCRALLIGDPEG